VRPRADPELKIDVNGQTPDARAQRAILSPAAALHNLAAARAAMRRNVGPAIMGIDIRVFR
jgi:hypothetical protein